MQCDSGADMVVDQSEEDQDSLFGSPPSSPGRGRSPSPALALPSASYSAQNVGTIALPGSHHYSELPVNPLALSWSCAPNEPPPRPPALSITGIHPSRSQAATPSSAGPSSRASSTGPSLRPKKKPHKQAKSTPRAPPPEIPLPDPSGPPPANFLRNQMALLGTAGLVAGIKPANLSHRHTRGANASNPIVVEDEDVPRLGRTSKFRQPYSRPVDPSLLPTPTTQDVVAMLIGQRDIFPVLESLLKLIAQGSVQTNTSSFRSSSARNLSNQQLTSQFTNPTPTTSSEAPPPTKKRKLNRVPAGAVDWDVPYPFPQGEGPDSYRTTWERERGKQLISQLVTLIKTAAKKAATRLYMQSEAAKKTTLDGQRAAHAQSQGPLSNDHGHAGEVKVHGHYRPSTVTYGLVGEAAVSAQAQVQEVLADASNGKGSGVSAPSLYPHVQPPTGSENLASGPQPSTPFDQLISSLLAATPNENVTKSGPAALPGTVVAVNSDTATNPDNPAYSSGTTASSGGGDGNGANVDQGLFDNWMNILQTFPMPSDGFAQTQASGIAEGSTTGVMTEDFGFFDDVDPNFDFDANMSTHESLSYSSNTMDAYMHFNNQVINDHVIDPALLAISVPQPSQPANVAFGNNVDNPPSLAPSPMSSIGGSGPTTPNTANWDVAYPEIVTGGGGLGGQGMWGHAMWNNVTQTQRLDQGGVEGFLETPMQPQNPDEGGDAQKQDKGKGRDVGPSLPQSVIPPSTAWTSTTTAPYQIFSYPGLVTSTSSLQTVPPTTVAKTLDKETILKRAAERKKFLMEELNRLKTQLWETTIEQGVLAHLSKQYNQPV